MTPEKTGAPTGESRGAEDSRTTPSVTLAGDAAMTRRRQAAARLAPLPDGVRDPLDQAGLPDVAAACRWWFECLSKPLDVLERVHHCPCTTDPTGDDQ